MNDSRLIFEKSIPGKRAWLLPATAVPHYTASQSINAAILREIPPDFPELSEIDVVRHYTQLSSLNHGVDNGFYPLGSCTMKYNPKINEDLAAIPEFQHLHPLVPEKMAQGTLSLLAEMEDYLKAITGMDAFTLQPAAGAHGELTSLFILKAYLRSRSQEKRTKVLVPASAHGTNPASAAMAGFEIITVKCSTEGLVDLAHLKTLLNEDIAALMLTNPNTLGLFERDIYQIAAMVHQAGGLLYYDGANLNAIMGLTRPGDMGFDLMHLNLHKTFAAPHGGGGPGAGPVGVKDFLKPFLPLPVLAKNSSGYYWDYQRPHSIGKIHGFYGNLAVTLKALLYIKAMGAEGLTQVSRDAVLNANYLRVKLRQYFELPYNRPCMHEFVLSANNLKPYHVRALDIAKRLLDFGIHPPTIYFPLIVEEAMMFEPTETEGLDTLNDFIEIMHQIYQEAVDSPAELTSAPHRTPITRVDETLAARNPKLRWKPANEGGNEKSGL
ncbi:MAG TPA: aminomethyl-transferring glycine dehydrogenase subunit GcvPB [Firmicutes bacterium]|jgi:glycine dehydrogenase subunit 2|nr:aminomethyl-transferring glycine dehydrogenase subunit GcvPB [Bacillota bacterium]